MSQETAKIYRIFTFLQAYSQRNTLHLPAALIYATSLQSGMSVKTLSKILGHANVGFTLDVYAHVTEQLKAEEMAGLTGFLT